MTTPKAAFRARNVTTSGAWSNFSDGGFDAIAGDVIEVQLESNPSLSIWMMQFSCIDRSNGRTLPVFDPVTGIASVPTAGVQFTMPGGEHGTWEIQGQANGGPQGPDGTTDPDYTCSRYFAVRTPNLDFRHPLAAETIQYLAAGGWAVALQEMMDQIDLANGTVGAPADPAYVVDSASPVVGLANAVLVQALASTLAFLCAGSTPATFAHQAAAGSSQQVLGLIREITAAGAGTVGTAAKVGWYTRNNAGTPAIAIMGSERVELTAVSGANLSGKRVWSTVNAGAEADKLTLFADGTLRLHALAGGGAQVLGIANTGDVSITGVGTTTLTTIVGAKVLENETVPSFTNGVPIKNLGDMLDFICSTTTPVRLMRITGAADDLYEALQLTLLGTSTSDIGNGPKIGFYGSNADVAPALLASLGARATDLTTDIESGELVFIARTGGVEGVIGWWGSDGLHVATDLIVAGTTTTVNSTTVDLADRIVHFNASTGVVAVPVQPCGFVIDRGATAGPVKRDMPGMLWSEANTRFDIIFNTAGDDTTLGSYVAVKLKALTVADFSTGVVHSNGSGVLSSSLLVNADVDAAAAIDGTKISPSFGAQNISQTGATSITAGTSGFIGSALDRASAGDLSIGGTATSITVRVSATTRVAIASDGSFTTSHGASAVVRREYGTSATRYVDHVSAVFTSDSSAGYETAISYTLPDNCSADIVFTATAMNGSTGDAAGYKKRRTVKRFSGGAATFVGAERDLGADNEDVVAYTTRTMVSGNAITFDVDSDTAAAKWGIDAEIHVTTTSA